MTTQRSLLLSWLVFGSVSCVTITLDGCGSTKTCVGVNAACMTSLTNCPGFVSWKTMGKDAVEMEMYGKVAGLGSYVGTIFSPTQSMVRMTCELWCSRSGSYFPFPFVDGISPEFPFLFPLTIGNLHDFRFRLQPQFLGQGNAAQHCLYNSLHDLQSAVFQCKICTMAGKSAYRNKCMYFGYVNTL